LNDAKQTINALARRHHWTKNQKHMVYQQGNTQKGKISSASGGRDWLSNM